VEGQNGGVPAKAAIYTCSIHRIMRTEGGLLLFATHTLNPLNRVLRGLWRERCEALIERDWKTES
jgi:hypothetical protein